MGEINVEKGLKSNTDLIVGIGVTEINSRLDSTRVSVEKVAYHKERLERYLDGELIYPVTVDVDLENRCSLQCPNCYTLERPHQSAEFTNIMSLFEAVQGHTKGLVISGGGEPLLYPRFLDVLKEARNYGFEEILVITGGLGLRKGRVKEALLNYATGIRISLNTVYPYLYSQIYGRDVCKVVQKDTEDLISERDRSGSNLEIGIGVLTNPIVANGMPEVVRYAESIGADWIQFRPAIEGFDKGVLNTQHAPWIGDIFDRIQEESNIMIIRSRERYETPPETISFSRYHAAHFVLTVAVDGTSWLGIECKEDHRYALGNIYDQGLDGFLQSERRLSLINNTGSARYPKLGAMTRMVLMSHFIEGINNGEIEIPYVPRIEHSHLV